MKKTLYSIVIVLGIMFSSLNTYAHCEVPCGIYGDQVRVKLIKEHITTIEKSMNQINKLKGDPKTNINQLVRWVNNKEEHAKKIQDIVSQYFLHQRVKITDISDKKKYTKYVQQLESLHRLLVYAMKSKQTTDTKFIDKMKSSLHDFEHAYFKEHKH